MSVETARRVALSAQGFMDRPVRSRPDRRHLRRVLDRTKLLQLDSVNVCVRAHYMPLFSRLGPYAPELVDTAAWEPTARRPRMLVEYWAHEASLLPVADWPLLRWRMRDTGGAWRTRLGEIQHRAPHLVDDVLRVIQDHGPMGAGAVERELGRATGSGRGAWWDRTDTKRACELLFATGQLTTGTRRGFERCYDLPERVLPPEIVRREVDDTTALRALVDRASSALGVATAADLRDYYRLSSEQARPAISDLVEKGTLEPVAVEGWRQRAYRHAHARVPRHITGRALLAPFDPLIWDRARTERLFGFRYRIEIYVPEAQRRHGYYVFPFLLDGQLRARVDLKAERDRDVLRVRAAFVEHAQPEQYVATELVAELRTMAEWLGLSGVSIDERGDLAPELARALRAAPH